MARKVKVLLVGEASPDEGSLPAQLEALGHDLELVATAEEALAAVEIDRPDVVVIDGTAPDIDGYDLATQIKQLVGDLSLPVMFACQAKDLRAEVEARDLGADDCFAKPIETEALAARIRLLLRTRDLETSLRERHRECEILNGELVDARDAINRELDLAGRIQRSLLPTRLPRLERFQFAAALRSSGAVSGDSYDIYRLDENHYGFYVADAIGHGVPAALLTIFVKKGLQTRDVFAPDEADGKPGGYRLLPPAEALTRLNRDIIRERLSANPFVTLFYAVLDARTGVVTFASGGHPPAILVRPDGSRLPCLSEGALLGIFESDFTTGEVSLTPGDMLVLYTDGIEQARFTGKTGLDALTDYLHADDGKDLSREEFIGRVERSIEILWKDEPPPERRDDVTVLVLRMIG